MLGLLLARQGVPVTLLEGHADFSREFRGDGIVRSPLRVLDQLGLLEHVFELSHSRHQTMAIRAADESIPLVGVGRVRTRQPYHVWRVARDLPRARAVEQWLALVRGVLPDYERGPLFLRLAAPGSGPARARRAA